MSYYRKIFGYIRGYFTSMVRLDNKAPICQRGFVKIERDKGEISVGERTTLWPGVKLAAFGASGKRARLEIGKRCSIGDRTQIHCGELVSIGDDVIIAWDCNILDRDYHSTDGGVESTAPVYIGDRVWIGCRAIILKGVTIGAGAVVAAGSVVTKDVAVETLVAGNPAVIKKKVNGWRTHAKGKVN